MTGIPNARHIAMAGVVLVWPVAALAMQSGDWLSPSINCAQTRLGSHALICRSDDLSDTERQLARIYENATARVDTATRLELEADQRAFVERRDGCDNTACLAAAYAARLAELARLSGNGRAETRAGEPASGRTLSITRQDGDASGEPAAGRTVSAGALADQPEIVQAAGPEPVGDPSAWLRADDYPSDVLRGGESGTTQYQIRVGTNGLATTCFTVGTSGNGYLDARACTLLRERARFTPARDTAGNSIPGIYSGSHEWVAPGPATVATEPEQ